MRDTSKERGPHYSKERAPHYSKDEASLLQGQQQTH